jgi:3'-phosphoadenosine 5'-phosphosulfate sulfotransferase (PAPS reductase)/FAD synthetase
VKHIVGFSGGIDSQAAAGVVLDKYGPADTILLNSNAGGNEDPLTDAFVDWYSANVHPVIRCNAVISDMWKTPNFAEKRGFVGEDTLTFQRMIEIKGRPPSRKAQFCTEILKLRPQARWVFEHFGVGGQYEGQEYVRYTGVRRDESEARKNTPDSEWDSYFDCEVFHIIAGWPKQQCFDFVLARNETINPLYLMGFNRVGCAPCINSSKQDIANWNERRPEMLDKIRQMEKATGRTYFAPCVPGKYTNTMDEVLAWAKTDHGGKQFKLPVEREPCESKYGLCE